MAACLLGLQVEVLPGAWISIPCKCCAYCQVEATAMGLSLEQGSPRPTKGC
jgi:hypothetical protein